MAENVRPYHVRLLANKSCRFKPDVRLVLLLKLLPFREWPHELKSGFMRTKQAFIEDDLAEIEKILEEEWITEEDRFRSIFNGLDKATV